MNLIYATFGSKAEALAVAQTLVAEGLVACANVLDGATSIYKWQGEIQQQSEAILFAKTAAKNAELAVARIKKLHSYELPCILILPVEGGFPPFIQWVDELTKD